MKQNIKKIGTYALILVVGLFLGKWIFSTSEDNHKHEHSHESSPETVKEEIWTCSMHPEIREDQPGDCPLCGMDLTLLNDDGSGDPNAVRMSARALQLAKVATGFPTNAPSEKSGLTLDGKLMFNEQKKQKLTADFHGRIDRLYIDFDGQEVKKGQVVAEVYSPELETLQKELLIAYKQKDENERLYNAAVSRLRKLNVSQTEIDQLISGKQIEGLLKIRSPFNGVVNNLSVRQGNHLERGDLLFEVENLDELWATFEAYERDANQIKVGDSIIFTTRAFAGRKWKAKINFISPTLRENRRTFTVRANVANTDGLLKPAFIIQGQLQRKTTDKSSIWVPKSAVLWTGKRSVVYEQVLEEEARLSFVMKEVSTGEVSGEYIEILEGIDLNTEIAIHGVFSIDGAAQIAAKPSMMNRREKKSSSVSINWQEVKINNETLNHVLENYLALKESLAEDEDKNSIVLAKDFLANVKKLDFSDEEAKEGLTQLVKDVSTSKNIDMARVHFQFLSDALIELVKVNKKSEKKLFLQYCPMADNDNGAFWLSEEEEIKNPYYGSMMLRCGTIEGEF